MKNDGPSLQFKAICFDCKHCVSESFTAQKDHGHDVYCIHPDAPELKKGRRHISSSRWDTPPWCPLLGIAIKAFREQLGL
jgi:hypothetical protein